jgi:preprotein translocase subunit SecD
MTRGHIYKGLFILLIIALSIMLVLPTFGNKNMEIYLDDNATGENIEIIKKRFSSSNYKFEKIDKTITISGRNLTDAIMNEVRTFKDVRDVKILKHWAENVFLAKKINLGLDLQGGMLVVLQANYAKREKREGKSLSEQDKSDLTQQALELIRNRIDRFGVSEPSIRPKGNDAIEVQLPGVKNPQGVKDAFRNTGKVEYRLVDEIYTTEAKKWIKSNLKDEKFPEEANLLDQMLEKIAADIKLPDTFELFYLYDIHKGSKKLRPQYPIALEKKIALAGMDISKAWVGRDEVGRLAVHFTTTSDGASKLSEVTSKKNHTKRMAIMIDDKVRSAPAINVQITTGQALINGNFSMDEVTTLTRIIKEGALPVDLQIIEERTVGPTLGQDSIESGFRAGIIALIGVMLFNLIYYKVSGFLADIGLFLNMIFMLALCSMIGFTLTVPGIAGFVLSAGMAVDATVLIFERIKEELKAGKSVRMSIKYGFDRVFWAIFDSNVSNLVAAFILMQFGTGPIKGFAVTLTIGVISSMFVALFVLKYIFELVSFNKKLKKLYI